MMETELLAKELTLDDLGPCPPGSGGTDDDGPGEGWGWSGDPYGDDETPYRRPRIIRAVAVILTLFVVAGSVGAWLAVLTLGPTAQYAAEGVHLAVPVSGPTADPAALVSFELTNQSARAGRAACTAVVRTAHATVGSATKESGRISAGGSTSLRLRVVVSPAALAGNGPARVDVRCGPLGSHSN
ncbi:MAG: hypothetical protein ACRDVW_08350 [Acidimicrobiales bacterium]